MERKAVVFDNRRQKQFPYPSLINENFDIKIFSFERCFNQKILERYDSSLIVHLGGDGSLGFLLDVLYKAYPNENIPPVLLLGGGTANTTLRGLANLRDEGNLCDDLVNIFPEEEFAVKSYRPLCLEIDLEDEKKDEIAAYLAGFGHLTVGVTKIFERIRNGINPNLAYLAYLTAASLSLATLHRRCQPQLLDFDGKTFSPEIKLAALAVLGVPYLATFDLNQKMSNEDFLLLSLQGKTEAELYLKYLTTLVIGGVFAGGVDWLIRRKLINLQKGRQVSVLPDQEKKPNACLDGELKRFNGPLTVKRADKAVTVIIPQEIVKRYKGK